MEDSGRRVVRVFSTHVFVIRAPSEMLFEVLGASAPDPGEVLQAPTEGVFLQMLGAPSAVPGVLRKRCNCWKDCGDGGRVERGEP